MTLELFWEIRVLWNGNQAEWRRATSAGGRREKVAGFAETDL
jgi:hypothetical protein